MFFGKSLPKPVFLLLYASVGWLNRRPGMNPDPMTSVVYLHVMNMTMNNTVRYIIFCVVVVLMVGLFAVRVNYEDTDPHAVPHIDTAVNGTGSVDLSSLKGKYVLVNFWDSHNAVSRLAAGEYDRFLRTHRNSNLRLLSVNTDDNRRLYDRIVSHDGLDRSTQFHISDTRRGSSAPAYHATEGYASYLVNPSGKVVALNPTVATLENILGK